MRKEVGDWLRRHAEKDGRGYPDWAMRYVPIVGRLRRRLVPDALVLEIGANESGMARFIGRDRRSPRSVIVLDRSIEHLQAARAQPAVRPVAADIGALPFADGGVDICVCADTFEHLSQETRLRAAREIARILRADGVAAIAFPSGRPASAAEQEIRDKYRLLTGNALRWFEEHAVHGLPDAQELAGLLRGELAASHDVAIAKNVSLVLWRWTWSILMCGWPGWGNALLQALWRLLTPVFCRVHVGTCYRSVLWVEPKAQ